jgi:hypothetical protein
MRGVSLVSRTRRPVNPTATSLSKLSEESFQPESTENDIIGVGGDGARCGEGVGARSLPSAVAAGPAIDAGLEGGGGAEWRMVERDKTRAAKANKTVMSIR